MNNFWQRTITGIFFVAVLAGSVIWHPVAFLTVFGLVNLFCLLEFYSLLNEDRFYKWAGTAIGLITWILIVLILEGVLQSRIWLLIPLPLVFLVFLYELFSRSVSKLHEPAVMVLGLVYITLPLVLLAVSGFLTGRYDHSFLLALLVFTWVNDTMAYVTGSLFGKHKFFERISPKKTWEGLAGGVAFSIGSAIVISHFYDGLTLDGWVFLAVICCIAGVSGDLFESALKRKIGVKDSGRFFPGHGGILDRFDALLFIIPFYYLYLVFTV